MEQLYGSASYSSYPISSLRSESVRSSNIGVFETQAEKLLKLEIMISKKILQMREKKIKLLEEINFAVSNKMLKNAQLKLIESAQLKNVLKEKKLKEEQLLKQLLLREKTQENLKEAIDRYRQGKKQLKIEEQLIKKIELERIRNLNMAKYREKSILDSKLKKLIGTEGSTESVEKEIYHIRNKKLEKIHKKSANEQIKPKDLKPTELQTVLQKFSIQIQQQVKNLIKQTRYPNQTTSNLQVFIDEEQKEKQALYQDLSNLKAELMRLKSENASLEQQIY